MTIKISNRINKGGINMDLKVKRVLMRDSIIDNTQILNIDMKFKDRFKYLIKGKRANFILTKDLLK